MVVHLIILNRAFLGISKEKKNRRKKIKKILILLDAAQFSDQCLWYKYW